MELLKTLLSKTFESKLFHLETRTKSHLTDLQFTKSIFSQQSLTISKLSSIPSPKPNLPSPLYPSSSKPKTLKLTNTNSYLKRYFKRNLSNPKHSSPSPHIQSFPLCNASYPNTNKTIHISNINSNIIIYNNKHSNSINIGVFITSFSNKNIINLITSYLSIMESIIFFSSSKKYKSFLIEQIQILKYQFFVNNNVTICESLSEKINKMKLKYTTHELNFIPEFKPSANTLKAIHLINENIYSSIFYKKKLSSPINSIIIVYRVFFQLINKSEIASIVDDDIFWERATHCIVNNNCNRIGDWFCDYVKLFDFSEDNVYKIKKMLGKHIGNMKESYYDKICETTALFLFLVKDALEYCGIINNNENIIPGMKYRNTLYLLQIERKIDNYITYIKNLF